MLPTVWPSMGHPVSTGTASTPLAITTVAPAGMGTLLFTRRDLKA